MGMNKKVDYLLGLSRLCEGNIKIDINYHRGIYEKAADYLKGKKFAGRITAEMYKDCVGKDNIIEITMLPSRTGGEVKLVGCDMYEVLYSALDQAKEILHLDSYAWLGAEYNCTASLEQLVAKCKASVHLDINEFKEKEFWDFDLSKNISNGTAKIYFNNLLIERPDVFDEEDGGGYEISPESRVIMEEKDTVLRLRWYDRTPVSFYNLFDHDLPRMLASANQATT